MKAIFRRWLTEERLAVLLPIGGFKLFWFATLGAAIVDLSRDDNLYSSTGEYLVQNVTVRWGTYLWLLAIALLAVFSTIGRHKAFAAAPTRLSHLAKGFTTVAVIASLIIGAFFGLMTFMDSINGGGTDVQHNLTVRILGVYLPILFDALILVAVVLWAFVAKRGDEDE